MYNHVKYLTSFCDKHEFTLELYGEEFVIQYWKLTKSRAYNSVLFNLVKCKMRGIKEASQKKYSCLANSMSTIENGSKIKMNKRHWKIEK